MDGEKNWELWVEKWLYESMRNQLVKRLVQVSSNWTDGQMNETDGEQRKARSM